MYGERITNNNNNKELIFIWTLYRNNIYALPCSLSTQVPVKKYLNQSLLHTDPNLSACNILFSNWIPHTKGLGSQPINTDDNHRLDAKFC